MTPEMVPAQRLHALDCVTTNTADGASPELVYDQKSSTTLAGSHGHSASSLSKREHFSSGSGSPIRQQSPLRLSVSHIERPDLPCPIPLRSVAATEPTKSPTDNDSRMRLTGDKRGVSTQSSCSRRDGSFSNASPDLTPKRLRNPSQASVMEATGIPESAASTPTSASRFSFLSTAFRGLTSSPATSPRPVDDSDDLINLNIDHTIHSMTSLTDRSTFSPAAFKNLQMVSTGLLHKFQDAYVQRTIEIRELRAEQAAQSEEQSEADTKMQHLRMQLEGMAQKAAEQEETMQALMSELAREKKLRTDQSNLMSGASSVSEDLAVEDDQRRKWRKSGGTSRSDTSYDTDEEGTEDASVFSTRSRSPTATTAMSDFSSVDCSPHFSRAPAPSKATPSASPSNTPRPSQAQVSAFQKLFKGLSVDTQTQNGSIVAGPLSCQNCQGQDVSVAWDTVSLLKDENQGLKGRVSDLEGVLEGALDVVNGVGL